MKLENPLAIVVCGETLSIWADRAVGWRDCLFVADLHLGKSAVFRAAGLPVPPGELDHDLARLAALIWLSGARRLIVLGDLVHGPVGPDVVARVAEWRDQFAAEWIVVRGNHDRHVPAWPAEWRLQEYGDAHREDPFRLCHQPKPHPGATVFAGHLHPMVSVGKRPDRMRFPAVVTDPGLVLLPAFTQFSGGPSVAANASRRRYACTPAGVLSVDE